MTDSSAAFWRVLGTLGDSPRKSGSGYEARCPAHEDRHASLSVGIGLDGRVLLNCHAGCPTEKVLAAMGLSLSDLFERSAAGNPVRRFRLLDRSGTTVATHVREDLPGDKKLWWESHGKAGLNGTPLADLPFYRLPDVLTADVARPVIVCEGEKAADALADLGLLAVGTVTGASGTPGPEVIVTLRGRPVWLWPDNDKPGREHMQRIARGLHELGTSPRWIEWKDAPDHGDAADYVAQGGTADGVQAMLESKPLAVAEPTNGSRLSVVRMSDVQPEPIEWLWRGRFARGKPTLLMGDPGLGKSLITHWLAARCSVGGEWPDEGACELGTAILFTIEDGLADTVAPRLLAAKAQMDRVIAVRGVVDEHEETTQTERMFALTQHLELLERLIRDTSAIAVVMDPITAYLGPDINSHKEADVRAVLGPLQMLAERTRVVLIMVMHLNKGTGVSALYRATGSIAFPAVARVVLGVAPDPNDDEGQRRLLLPVKMNIGKLPEGIGYHIETAHAGGVLPTVAEADQPPVLVWDLDPVEIDATSAMDRNGSVAELGAVAEAKRAMAQILAGGRVPATECKRQIRESTGVTNETSLVRARRELGVRVRKEGFGAQGAWFWEFAPKDSRARARVLPIPALEAMVSLPSVDPSIDTKDYEDYKETNLGNRARARESLCRKCGGELSPGLERIGLHYECTMPYKEDW